MTWDENARRLYEEHAELNDLAAALGEGEAAISPEARAVLDKIVEPKRSPLDIAIGALGTELSRTVPVVGGLVEATFNASQDKARKRRARRQMSDSEI